MFNKSGHKMDLCWSNFTIGLCVEWIPCCFTLIYFRSITRFIVRRLVWDNYELVILPIVCKHFSLFKFVPWINSHHIPSIIVGVVVKIWFGLEMQRGIHMLPLTREVKLHSLIVYELCWLLNLHWILCLFRKI